MTIEALIFDVDGTMADTEEAHRTAFNLAFGQFRLGWNWRRDEYHELLSTNGGKERIREYIRLLDVAEPERRRLRELVPSIHAEKDRFYSSAVSDGAIMLRPGVARMIEAALSRGLRLAIASTTTASSVDALLKSNLGVRGLDMFSVVACGDQVRVKKPAPDIYRLALEHLGLPPYRCVAFEDSPNGLRAAVSAGLWTVVTPTYWTEDGDFSAAGLLLPSLGDPDHPLPGEPGKRLRQAAWLTLDELTQLAQPRPPRSAVQALYQAAP